MSQGTKGAKGTRAPLTLVAQPGKRGAPLSAQSAPQEAETDTNVADGEKVEKPAGMLYNAHDVKRLEDECSKITQGFLKLGAQPQRLEATITSWRQAATVFSLGRLMMAKGLVTEEELQGAELACLKDILLQELQAFENAQLKARAQATAVQPVRQPGLIVARH